MTTDLDRLGHIDILAQQVKDAARTLNQAIERASAEGLRVEIDLRDITAIGRERQYLVSVDVLKSL